MRGVDPDRIADLVGSMRNSVRLLEELAGFEEDEFFQDPHKQSSAKYNFIAAIEAAIDIANHIISRQRLRVPEDYADTFLVLSEAGIVDADFAGELQKMGRFRNRLVHRYWDVDTAELRLVLRSRLGDFEDYIAQVTAHAIRKGGGSKVHTDDDKEG